MKTTFKRITRKIMVIIRENNHLGTIFSLKVCKKTVLNKVIFVHSYNIK